MSRVGNAGSTSSWYNRYMSRVNVKLNSPKTLSDNKQKFEYIDTNNSNKYDEQLIGNGDVKHDKKMDHVSSYSMESDNDGVFHDELDGFSPDSDTGQVSKFTPRKISLRSNSLSDTMDEPGSDHISSIQNHISHDVMHTDNNSHTQDDFFTGDEPGDIGDRLTVFEEYERTHQKTKEEVSPGKLKSPFIDGGLKEVASPVEKDQIHFTEMSNVRNRFETADTDDTTQAHHVPRCITPPRDFEKTEYESENVERDPTIVRAEDTVNEEEFLPKVGSSRQILQRFQEVTAQERDYRPKQSFREEMDSVTRIEYENEPERFEQWQNKTEGGIFENEPEHNPDVARETDPLNYAAELPEQGYTRNVLKRFNSLKDQESPHPRRQVTPPRQSQSEYSNEPQKGPDIYEGTPEAGIFESQPVIRDDVVHADEEEVIVIPQHGYARTVANMFKQMESSTGTSKTVQKKEFTPPRSDSDNRIVIENTPSQQEAIRESDEVEDVVPTHGFTRNIAMRFQQMQDEPSSYHRPEQTVKIGNNDGSGIFENTPESRPGVVHSSDLPEEPLPEYGLAKNRVAQFRQLESVDKTAKHGTNYKEFTPPRSEPRVAEQRETILRQRSSSTGQAEQLPNHDGVDGGVFENEPESRPDISREADTIWNAGLPSQDTTKNLVARFKNIQKVAEEDSKTPKPLQRKEGASKFRGFQLEKCDTCRKTVYITERFEFNKGIYHKTCFKCSHCRRPLTPATYAVNEHTLYCMNHYKQMFKAKGNYDEGFGRTQYKKRWQSEPNLSASSDDESKSSR